VLADPEVHGADREGRDHAPHGLQGEAIDGGIGPVAVRAAQITLVGEPDPHRERHALSIGHPRAVDRCGQSTGAARALYTRAELPSPWCSMGDMRVRPTPRLARAVAGLLLAVAGLVLPACDRSTAIRPEGRPRWAGRPASA